MRKYLSLIISSMLVVSMISGCSVKQEDLTISEQEDISESAAISELPETNIEEESKEDTPEISLPQESSEENVQQESEEKEGKSLTDALAEEKSEPEQESSEIQTEEIIQESESSAAAESSSEAAVQESLEEEESTENKAESAPQGNQETPATKTEEDAIQLSENWLDMEIAINGWPFRMLDSKYAVLADQGWTLDLDALGYPNGYILNPGDKTAGTTPINNPEYADQQQAYRLTLEAGFTNLSDAPCDITESTIWCIHINNRVSPNHQAENPVNFKIAKNIRNGSTYDEIMAAFGESYDTYRSDELGYTSLTYYHDFNETMRLVIYDDTGLQEITLEKYSLN